MKMIYFFAVLFLGLVFSTFGFTTTSSTALAAVPHVIHKLNLNTADVKLLSKSFKGIGKKRAAAIVAYRTAHGAFKSVKDLSAVKGIGNAFVKAHLTQLESVFTV